MKRLAIFLSVIGLISLNSCKQETDVSALLKNTNTRNQIMDTIAKNPQYMADFKEHVKENGHAMQMMQNDKSMGSEMNHGKMMSDSMQMKKMMGKMMEDGETMGTMMKMMHKRGMMSKDCMKSCKRMMKEKGIDMSDDESDMDESKKENNHGSHH